MNTIWGAFSKYKYLEQTMAAILKCDLYKHGTSEHFLLNPLQHNHIKLQSYVFLGSLLSLKLFEYVLWFISGFAI